eukprot:7572608-Pyramimonas_sp.AAC.1
MANDIELARATVSGVGREPTFAALPGACFGVDDAAGAKRSAARAGVILRSRLRGARLRR